MGTDVSSGTRFCKIAVTLDSLSCHLNGRYYCSGIFHLPDIGAREFASAEEFIAGDDEEACDCVITDVRMPGMSGLELSHLIASRQSPVPVIMVTAVRERGLERAAAKSSFCLLKKPVGTDVLIECLQRALEG